MNRSLPVVVLSVGLGVVASEGASAWQLRPVNENEAPALKETPASELRLLTPEASGVERSESEPELQEPSPLPVAAPKPIEEPSQSAEGNSLRFGGDASDQQQPDAQGPARLKPWETLRPQRREGATAPVDRTEAGANLRRVTPGVTTREEPEAFLLRAEQLWRRRPKQALADIQQAAELKANSVRTLALRARILVEIGRPAQALAALEAIDDAHEDARLRLLRAEALYALGRFEEAEADAQRVLEDNAAPLTLHAAAMRLRGDIAAHGPNRDVRGAMTLHQEAARLASAALQDHSHEGRAEAIHTAIDADLAIARDLSQGNWRNRSEAFAQWIRHAEKLAENLEAEDSRETQFRIHCAALAGSASLEESNDAKRYAASATEAAAELLVEASDAWGRAAIQWRLGEALFEASQSLHADGQHELARDYAQDALRLLESSVAHRGVTEASQYLLGRMYFFLGSDQAVVRGDHPAAIEWYEKAAPLLIRTLPPGREADRGVHGERLVSMGVSYWQTEQREKAVALTEAGMRLMREAVEAGGLNRTALAVPLNNLAAMNRVLGNIEQAEQYRTRLVDFQTPADE